MHAVKSGGTGTTGFSVEPAVLFDADATDIQCSNAVFVIGVPPTCTTALPGMPPHAVIPTRANKTAPSAEVYLRVFDTTAGTLAESTFVVLNEPITSS